MYTLLLGLTLSNIIPSRPSIFNYVLEEKGFLFHSALCLLKLGKWLVSMSTTEDIEQKVFWRCWNHWIFLEFIFSFLWNKLFMCHANLAKMINYLLCCIEIREMLCSPFWIFSMCWPPPHNCDITRKPRMSSCQYSMTGKDGIVLHLQDSDWCALLRTKHYLLGPGSQDDRGSWWDSCGIVEMCLMPSMCRTRSKSNTLSCLRVM